MEIREKAFVKRRYTNDDVDIGIERGEVESSVARFAMAMIERWGMVSSVPDGEDSSGRSKLRLSTPEELVQRACDTAAAAFVEFRKRGWMVDVPYREDAIKSLGKD